MPENDRKPLLSGVMRWFLFTMVLANTGIFMQQPLLPLYLQELGASVTQVGLVFTLSSIVPLLLRHTERTSALVAHLRQNGILATGLNYPVVPKGDQTIRFQISADHTPHDIAEALDVLGGFSG